MRRGLIHHLRAVRSRIHMAVRAGLVALAADIDLQRLKRAASERDTVSMELFLKTVHEGNGALATGTVPLVREQ